MDQTGVCTTLQEEVYRDLLGQFKIREAFKLHDAMPVSNLHADVSSLTLPFKSQFPFRVYRPKPLCRPSPVSISALKEEDPLLSIVTESKVWEDQLRKCVRVAKKSKIWGEIQKYPVKAGKVSKGNEQNPVYAPHAYIDVVKHLEKQPIPDFCGSYNWLATGGNIAHCGVEDETVILVPSGEIQDKLNVIPLINEGNGWVSSQFQATQNIALHKGERIFQTVATEGEGLAAVRQLKSCSIVVIKLHSEGSFSPSCPLEIREERNIFTSVDLCTCQPNIFCTLTSEHILKVWDLHTSSYYVRGRLSPPEPLQNMDKWNHVKFSNNSNEVLICNRHNVLIKDLRAPLTDNILEFSVSNLVNNCEQLTYMLPTHSNFAYVASSHFLFHLDYRAGWLQRWTHFLNKPPVYGAVQSLNDKELVLLSSHSPNDCTALVNTFEEGKPQSSAFPACLPSVGDCLLWAQAQGECLGPSFSKRFKTCLAGLTILPCRSDSLTSVTSTSIGDVFSQLFTIDPLEDHPIKAYRSEEQDLLDLEVWKEWEKDHDTIYHKTCPPLKKPAVSREKLFSYVIGPPGRRPLSNRVHLWKNSFKSKEEEKRNGPSPRPGWTDTVSDLKTFNDLLAGLLLDPWISNHTQDEQPSAEHLSNVDDECSEMSPVYENLNSTSKRSASPISSDSELDSASVLGRSLGKSSQEITKKVKKMKHESQGF